MPVDLSKFVRLAVSPCYEVPVINGQHSPVGAFQSLHQLQTFIGNLVIGGKDAPTPADGAGFLREADFARLRIIETERLDDGLLVRWGVVRE